MRADRTQQPDVIFVPTPQEVVDKMLELAKVGKGDVLYDLGSGDGRIPVTAAKRFGIRAVGIDIDPQRIAEANENARKNGVTNLVTVQARGPLQDEVQRRDGGDAVPAAGPEREAAPAATWPSSSPARASSRTSSTWAPGSPSSKVELNGRTIYFWTIPQRKQ